MMGVNKSIGTLLCCNIYSRESLHVEIGNYLFVIWHTEYEGIWVSKTQNNIDDTFVQYPANKSQSVSCTHLI